VATRHLNEFGEREPSTMTISVVDLTGNFTEPEADVLMVRPFAQTSICLPASSLEPKPATLMQPGTRRQDCNCPAAPTASVNPSGGKEHFGG
jgi:hypothetical protein